MTIIILPIIISPLQIRFDSFTAPLLLLGCFAKDNTHFKTTPTNRSHDLSPEVILSSGSFTNFEAEFKTWQQPSQDLDTDSSIFCAAEIFRFLRDMALDVSTNSSTSLICLTKFDQDKEKNFYGSPPVTAAKLKGGTTTNHLVHPGAVLCMLDLLPAVEVELQYYRKERSEKMVSGEIMEGDLEMGQIDLSTTKNVGNLEHGQNVDNFEQELRNGGKVYKQKEHLTQVSEKVAKKGGNSLSEGVKGADIVRQEVASVSELERGEIMRQVPSLEVISVSGDEQTLDSEECSKMTLVEAKKVHVP